MMAKRNEFAILDCLDNIIVEARSIEILARPNITMLEAQRLINKMKNEYEGINIGEGDEPSDWDADKEHIDADNRARAKDMNKINGGQF